MSDSVNDELEQLLDEWIESIMREVRKAREARLAEIQQELMPYQPGSIPSNKSLKRGGAPGMACRRPQSTRPARGRNYTTGEIKILSRKNTEVKDK